MMGALDYIRWRGDLSFRTDPFNEVDNLIFSQMIYGGYEEVIRADERITIRELGERYFGQHKQKLRFPGRDGSLVMGEIYKTERFGECYIYHYESFLHADTAEQFTACMIDLPDHTTVVCFMGTDDNLIGWKEDLYLSYKDIVSQFDALDYVNRFCTHLTRKYRFMGHSKGGYLALYAAVHCKPQIQNRILEIYSDDGPGLRPGTFAEEDFEKVKDRYTLIVPELDGVGTIFENARKKIVARINTKNIIEAHSVLKWQVLGKRIISAEADSFQTDQTRIALRQFLHETTPEQREIFVEEVFEALSEAGITTTTQLATGGLPILIRVIRHLSEIDSVARDIALKLLKTLSGTVTSTVSKVVNEKREDVRHKARSVETILATKIASEIIKDKK